MQPPQPSWTQHMDIIVPGVMVAFKTLIGVIAAIGGLLCTILVWLGKQIIKKVTGMDSKLEKLHDTIIACDGCKVATAKFGRKNDDNAED